MRKRLVKHQTGRKLKDKRYTWRIEDYPQASPDKHFSEQDGFWSAQLSEDDEQAIEALRNVLTNFIFDKYIDYFTEQETFIIRENLIGEIDYRTISKALKISVSTVRNIRQEAIVKLRALISEEINRG